MCNVFSLALSFKQKSKFINYSQLHIPTNNDRLQRCRSVFSLDTKLSVKHKRIQMYNNFSVKTNVLTNC